ncbi:DUF971 domain-containing protein [Pirellulales bacterium]|nr:DUF971 domain-containing protein [Pirellulales bacterium]
MDIQPTELKLLDPEHLQITWNDGQVRRYEVAELRRACPCATCLEKHGAPKPPPTELPVITTAETEPLRIDGMTPTGRYAYSIKFSDGHDTGLFTLDRLRKLGTGE